jgi:hypothetical protein
MAVDKVPVVSELSRLSVRLLVGCERYHILHLDLAHSLGKISIMIDECHEVRAGWYRDHTASGENRQDLRIGGVATKHMCG